MIPFKPETSALRLGLLCAFTFIQGVAIGPLLSLILNEIKDGAQIIFTAFFSTVIIFGCFSLAAFLSPRRSWLYLGGTLFSGLALLLCFSIANRFFQNSVAFSIEIYLGLFLFVGFVIFDTQLIVEKAINGDRDYTIHALELFLDFMNIFIRILIILARKKRSNSSGSNLDCMERGEIPKTEL